MSDNYVSKYTGAEIDAQLDKVTQNEKDIATKVSKTTTINSKPLSDNISLNKTDIGLSNVDNTSDLNKPVSTATQTAIDANYNWARKTSFSLSDLKSAVADGNLEKYGLKVGDQTTINKHTYVIAGLNPMKGTEAPWRVKVNHVGLICIPHTTTAWNVSGNTYTGADGRGAGYANSDLHYYLTNTVLPLVETDLGADNLIAHTCFLSSQVNNSGYNRFGTATGCTSSASWKIDTKIVAMSEVQVYGGVVWSSSGFDTGDACRQLEVFQRYSHTEIFGSEYPWLKDVGSATVALYAHRYGIAHYGNPNIMCNVAGFVLFH